MWFDVPPPVPSASDFTIGIFQSATDLDHAQAQQALVQYEPWARDRTVAAAQKFAELRERWLSETLFSSSLAEITCHDAYQAIIGMGEEALPLILTDLQDEPRLWFSALRAIVGFDPVPDDAAGDLDAMAAYWLDWAKETGYLD